MQQYRKASIIGNPSLRIKEEYYLSFFNQQQRAIQKKERQVFSYDYQIFLWAFILGYSEKKQSPIEGKTNSAFKWEIIERRTPVSKKILGLTLMALYENNPEGIKEDYQNRSDQNPNESVLSSNLRNAIEEYANTGFEIIAKKEFESPGYLNDGMLIIQDILGI